MLSCMAVANQIQRFVELPTGHPQPMYVLYTSKYNCSDCKQAEEEFIKLTTEMLPQNLAIVDCDTD